MALDLKSGELPIFEILEKVIEKLENSNRLVISAPPGAGKSTVVPLALKDADWLSSQKVIMLEPRRLAARSIAERMSVLNETKVGEEIGYKIRFDNCCSNKTMVEVVTEGILTRLLQNDNTLDGYGVVVFDEFHERSIHADTALAFCLELQEVLRPDLKIVVMSATLNVEELSIMLKAPVVESKGRQYPVAINYSSESYSYLEPEVICHTVSKALSEEDGDVLVFLPGQAEILQCEKILEGKTNDIEICPLYGQLPQSRQLKAIKPDRQGRRKVVLATSIAETSLTIEGVKVVVDSGLGRVSRFDPSSGLTRLETVRVAQDAADQRAGRAGRLSAGVCYRMWTAADHDRMDAFSKPEITECDLASLLLETKKWGIDDISSLQWMTQPPVAKVEQASEILHHIGALENGKITSHGNDVYTLPCHPRLAHMLLMAKLEGLASLATDVAAVLEERDPLPQGTGVDINLRIEALRRYRSVKKESRKFARIEKVASVYRKIIDAKTENTFVDPTQTGLLLSFAYPERIACARPGNNAQFQLVNGKYVMIHHTDSIAHEAWLSVAAMDDRKGTGKVFLASPLNPKDLTHLVKQEETVEWNEKKGGLVASLDVKIGSIVLKSTPLSDYDEELAEEAVCNAVVKDGEHLLSFLKDVEQWQSRVMSLRVWEGNEWPDVTTGILLEKCNEWLPPYLIGVKKNEDLKKINLVEALNAWIGWDKQQQLDVLAPVRIKVPSGSMLRLKYLPNGDAPVLAARIQEVFGLENSPTVNNGKVPVLMHLLSPGFKPVQVTSDLKSFWNNAYYEVKKELRIRYSKHVWPDDPWNEPAIKGVKRKKK